MNLENKNILVIGAGISGFASSKITKRLGANVTLIDSKLETELKYNFNELRELNINLKFGNLSNDLLKGVDFIIVSPRAPINIPFLQTAIQNHIKIMSEVELGYHLAKSPICAVTGTNGKTTTVTLLGLLLKHHKVAISTTLSIQISQNANSF